MKRLLIIDDDPAIRGLLRLGIENAEWTVTETGCTKEAVQEATANPFEAVTIDLSLGMEDGMYLIQEMRKLLPKAAIYVLTGKDLDPSERSQAIKSGADACLSKIDPFMNIVTTVTSQRSLAQ